MNKMKVMFVVKSRRIETLGPMYLAAIVKKLGHEAIIVEYKNAISVSNAWMPHIIGYSVMTGDHIKFQQLNVILKKSIDFISIVGGPHATFFPQFFLKDPYFDQVVVGEGELWLGHFLKYLTNTACQFPTDLDLLPFPDRTDFPNMLIRDFIASRGCNFKCTYCFNDKWHELHEGNKHKVRYRSVDNVIKEIHNVVDCSFKIPFIYFQDSCFAPSTRWMEEFAMKYPKLPYHCHLRPDQVTHHRAFLLKESNCVSMRMALETGSDRLRKLIGRPTSTNEQTIRAARFLYEYDIDFMIQNMLGLPTSTIEDDLHTLEINIQCKPAYGWSSIFVPFPGTALGDQCIKEGWYKGNYNDITDSFFNMSVLEFDEQHKEQLYVLQKIFALAVEAQLMPEISDLTLANMPMFVHKAMRKIGDNRLYKGMI